MQNQKKKPKSNLSSLPPKNKWSAEEEQALRDGVDRFGAGKWRVIQKDAVLGAILSTRSNVDLKVSGLRTAEGGEEREREREKRGRESLEGRRRGEERLA